MKKFTGRQISIIPLSFLIILLSGFSSKVQKSDLPGYKTIRSGFLLYLPSANKISGIKEELNTSSIKADSDSFLVAHIMSVAEQTLAAEKNYSFESWMSNPDSFITSNKDNPADEETQREEKIRFEDWMVNVYGWINRPCN
jgi:hypothetical protein